MNAKENLTDAVFMSTQPKWCRLIVEEKKTGEVRKNYPKKFCHIETDNRENLGFKPFLVYIYCTKEKRKNALHTYINSGYGRVNFGVLGTWRSGKEIVDVNAHLPAYRYNSYLAEGKVIGEFVCNGITPISVNGTDVEQMRSKKSFPTTELTDKQIMDYLGKGKVGYIWNISDLVIYDKPKELSEFWKADKCPYASEDGCAYKYHCFRAGQVKRCGDKLTRPPQSWCYVNRC